MNALDFWSPDVERRKLCCCKAMVGGARALQLQDRDPMPEARLVAASSSLHALGRWLSVCEPQFPEAEVMMPSPCRR